MKNQMEKNMKTGLNRGSYDNYQDYGPTFFVYDYSIGYPNRV